MFAERNVVLMSSSSDSGSEFDCRMLPGAGTSTDICSTEHSMSQRMDHSEEKAPKKKRGHLNIITIKLAAALDRCKMSDRDAVHILIATTEALGHSVGDYAINRTSIRNFRTKIRKERAIEIKNHFKDKTLQAAVLHWDGKLLLSLTGRETVHRLPVILSNGETEQLLAVPILESGTGRDQASAVCEAIAEWGLQMHVKALSFDTTATNTGCFTGACVLIEQFLDRDLLYLPCRHHIYEIILRSVFEEKMGTTSGPEELLFKRFQTAWSGIDVRYYQSGIDNIKVKRHLNECNISRILQFVRGTMKEQQPREDYRELLELTLIFLGEAPYRGIHFRQPGAYHHARWMAKAIYCLKIFMFRSQFALTPKEENGIGDICIFIVTVYVEAWFSVTSAAKAPYIDFTCLSKLYDYQGIDRNISRVALKKLTNHLWYLSPEAVALALFDPQLPCDTKKKMVDALNNEIELSEEHEKRIRIAIDSIPDIIDKGLEQFVSTQTMKFFTRFHLNTDFLTTDVSLWHKNKSYRECVEMVNNLAVVNDSAERGVKLMEDYNDILTKNEEQKQYVLQIVREYRKKFPDSAKATLAQHQTL